MSERRYLEIAKEIMDNGHTHDNRTGTNTKRVINRSMRFDLSNNKIPVFTTKKVHWKSVVMEMAWMLSGQTNVNYLKDNGVRIWNEWSLEDGSLGPVYGKQFRDQTTTYRCEQRNEEITCHVDPLRKFIEGIKENPESRRHIISLWNQAEISMMQLPPCHGVSIQASVIEGKLYLQMYQRSCDMFLGVPFNVAWYSLFTHMIAKECGLEAEEFIWTGHDCHVYENHSDQLDLQMSREIYDEPTIKLDYDIPLLQLLDYVKHEKPSWDTVKDWFRLENYKHHDAIKAKVAV